MKNIEQVTKKKIKKKVGILWGEIKISVQIKF